MIFESLQLESKFNLELKNREIDIADISLDIT